MADNTAIEWTDATWNPVRAADDFSVEGAPIQPGWHCEHVSEGCRNCYAEGLNRRLGTGVDYKPGLRGKLVHYLQENLLLAPLRWKRPRRVFLSSMTDVFGAWVSDDMLDRIFAVMALTPQHTYQVLTKRPGRARQYLSTGFFKRADAVIAMPEAAGQHGWPRAKATAAFHSMQPLPNVWLGTSVEDQRSRTRLLDLAATPAAVRFMSGEPLLEGVTLNDIPIGEPDQDGRQWMFDALTGEQYFRDDLGFDITGDGPDMAPLDWVIVGGESGRNARPMHPDWARALRDQCQGADVPFFFKQWGEWQPGDGWYIDHSQSLPLRVWDDGQWREVRGEDESYVARIGKRAAGRLLDGIEHNGVPA